MKKVDSEITKKTLELIAQGKTIRECSILLDVNYSTLYNRVQDAKEGNMNINGLTNAQIQYFIDNYGDIPTKDIAAKLGVKTQALNGYRFRNPEKFVSNSTLPQHTVNYIKEHHLTKTASQIAKDLKISIVKVREYIKNELTGDLKRTKKESLTNPRRCVYCNDWHEVTSFEHHAKICNGCHPKALVEIEREEKSDKINPHRLTLPRTTFWTAEWQMTMIPTLSNKIKNVDVIGYDRGSRFVLPSGKKVSI